MVGPMHNVVIHRTHWAIYQNVLIRQNHVQIKSKGTKNIFRMPKLHGKRRLVHHDAAVADEDGPKQTLSESFVRTKGDECDKNQPSWVNAQNIDECRCGAKTYGALGVMAPQAR